jgi:hypothetical protein
MSRKGGIILSLPLLYEKAVETLRERLEGEMPQAEGSGKRVKEFVPQP